MQPYYHFKHVHKDDKLAKIAWNIEQLGVMTSKGWKYLEHKYKDIDDKIKEYRKRERQLQETPY